MKIEMIRAGKANSRLVLYRCIEERPNRRLAAAAYSVATTPSVSASATEDEQQDDPQAAVISTAFAHSVVSASTTAEE